MEKAEQKIETLSRKKTNKQPPLLNKKGNENRIQ